MRDKFYKFMPILWGVFLGWLLFHPPAWFQALGPLAWVINTALCALLLLGIVPLIILATLPSDLKTKPMGEHELPPALHPIRDQFLRLGFRQVGSPLKVEMAPAAVVVGFIHATEPVYGTAYQTTTIPAKTSFDFVSILEGDQGGLTTNAEPAGACLPSGSGGFRQVLQNEGIDQLFRAHLEGIAFLYHQGIRVRPLQEEMFVQDLTNAIRHQRKLFLSAPIQGTLLTFWRSATKQVPFVGRLKDQPVAAQQIESFRTGQTQKTF
jgi:hypothetical protein